MLIRFPPNISQYISAKFLKMTTSAERCDFYFPHRNGKQTGEVVDSFPTRKSAVSHAEGQAAEGTEEAKKPSQKILRESNAAEINSGVPVAETEPFRRSTRQRKPAVIKVLLVQSTWGQEMSLHVAFPVISSVLWSCRKNLMQLKKQQCPSLTLCRMLHPFLCLEMAPHRRRRLEVQPRRPPHRCPHCIEWFSDVYEALESDLVLLLIRMSGTENASLDILILHGCPDLHFLVSHADRRPLSWFQKQSQATTSSLHSELEMGHPYTCCGSRHSAGDTLQACLGAAPDKSLPACRGRAEDSGKGGRGLHQGPAASEG